MNTFARIESVCTFRDGLSLEMLFIRKLKLSVLEITLALVFLIQAVPTDEKEKGNTGNCNGGNSIPFSFINYASHCTAWLSYGKRLWPKQ